jgi:4'-phosphopantetheinyl transferase
MVEIRDPVAVHSWSHSVHLALDELPSDQGFTVFSIAVPDVTIRPVARDRIRAALRETLGALLHRPAASITLISYPGQAIFLDSPLTCIGLSVSHAPGLSVAAIHRSASIGVDVMRVEPGIDWLPDWERVAQGYLGPQAYDRIAKMSPEQRAPAFAQEWTCFEACLKCLGIALTEWTPSLEQSLASCCVRALELPENYRGAMATK